MKRTAAIIALVMVVSLTCSIPVAAKAGGPPVSGTEIDFSEVLYMPGLVPGQDYIPVEIHGIGSFTGHVVKPTSDQVIENSWFELTSFNGVVYLFGNLIPYDYDGTLKIMIHLGNQSSMPNITIKSSVPIFVPILNTPYTDIKIVGGKIIFAK